jgi:RNA polymerase sigma factor (sigma-70 family)
LAEDVTQVVAVRAWSGYRTLRDPQAFKAWVFKIADREIKRELARRYHAIEVTRDPTEQEEPRSVPVPGENHEQIWIRAISEGVAHGMISQLEAEIIRTKTLEEKTSWNQIAARLNISATSCATIHCRAMPKLFHFILEYRSELVGGIDRIQGVFQNCGHLLTAAEAESFRRIIIEKDRSYRGRGRLSALRSASNKLARHLRLCL